jgi:hypothetical protein
MKKITTLLLLMSASVFAQQKSTGDIAVSGIANGISCNFTLDNTTSKVTLVVKGPSDRWFGIGVGVSAGFGMGAGDALVYSDVTTPKLTDRNFVGFSQPPLDALQDWTIVGNTTFGLIRTLTLTRNLTNSDSNDFQLPYATTNSISFACVRPGSATTTVAPHGGTANVGYATANFTTLGVEDFTLNATQIYPNPSNGAFTVKTKTGLDKINVYSQVGAFVKTIIVNQLDATEVSLKDLATGVYLIELQNATDKSWKKIIVN